MDIANVTVKNEWVDLQDLITEQKGEAFEFNPNLNYYLSNSTHNPVLFLNREEKPEDSCQRGLVVSGHEQCGLKLNTGKVYARCLRGSTDIHIEVEG